MTYDPDQPRAPKGVPEGGQWVEAGKAARAAAGLPAVSEKAEQACSEFAAKYRNLAAYERCEFIDPDTGEVFFDKSGLETSIDLTEVFWLYRDRCKGAILTHNHCAMEAAHSTSDILTAGKLQLGQIRVVTPLYQHILAPGERGWDGVFDMPLNKSFEMAKTLATGVIRNKYGNAFSMAMTDFSKGPPAPMAVEWVYEMMSQFASSRGLRYCRIPNK
jgi:hypothetical protein